MSLEDELHDHGVVEETDLGDGVRDAIEALEEVEQREGHFPEAGVAGAGPRPRLLEVGGEDFQTAAQTGAELEAADLAAERIAQRAETGDRVRGHEVTPAIEIDGGAGDLAGPVGGEMAVEIGGDAAGGRGWRGRLHDFAETVPQECGLGNYKLLLIFYALT